MNQPHILEFALSGSVAGKPISAKLGVPFARFAEFNEDVQKYVQGSDTKSVLREVQVQVDEGSLLLRVIIPAGLLPSLVADTARIATSGSLADIDRHRAEVVVHWQERAQMDPSLAYVVRNPTGGFAPLVVTHATAFQREERGTWVASQHYLIGEITDWGGASAVNVHLRVRNTRKIVTIAATPEQIRQQRDNLVLHHARVHVTADQELRTGELRNLRLLDLQPYAPKADEAQLARLFERGAKAWANVGSATGWVEEVRGNTHG